MQTIKILDFLIQELKTIKYENENKLYREGYIQAIKDLMTAYEGND